MTEQVMMTDEQIVEALKACSDDQLVSWFLNFRAFLEAEAAAQAAYIAPHVKKQIAVQNELHRRLLERNPNWQPGMKASGSTADGTFFLKTNNSIKVADREQFFQFLTDAPEHISAGPEAGNPIIDEICTTILQRIREFVTAHVAKEAVEGYMDAHKALPPGISIDRITKLEVRKT